MLTLWPFTEEDGRGNDAHKILEALRARSVPDATGYASSLIAHGFATDDLDPWLRDAVKKAAAIETTVSEGFLEAVAQADLQRAEALIDDFGIDHSQTVRAYLDAYGRNDTAKAEARLIAPGSGAFSPTWIMGKRLRELTLVAILAAESEHGDADHRLTLLEGAIANDATPNPHWTTLIARARERVRLVSPILNSN